MTEAALIPVGDHQVTIQSWAADTNKNGKPFAWVKFSNGLFWRGYFVPGAIEHTVKGLYVAGFRGKTPNDLNAKDALQRGKEVSVTVEHEDYNGKVTASVAWINNLFTQKKVDPAAVKVLGGIDLRAFVAESAKDDPNWKADQKKEPLKTKPDDDIVDTDTIPF